MNECASNGCLLRRRLRGTAVRRAHKAEAMAHLRAKLLLPKERGGAGGEPFPLGKVGELLADVRLSFGGAVRWTGDRTHEVFVCCPAVAQHLY